MIAVTVGAFAYAAGGIYLGFKTGKPLGLDAHPHAVYIRSVKGLVLDGVAFSLQQLEAKGVAVPAGLKSALGGGRGGGGGYDAVPNAAASAAAAATAKVEKGEADADAAHFTRQSLVNVSVVAPKRVNAAAAAAVAAAEAGSGTDSGTDTGEED